jgi:hypothetical protein
LAEFDQMQNGFLMRAGLILVLLCSWAYGRPFYIGYSGAPGSNGRCASSCHGSSGGTIEISGFPLEYVPGHTYTVSISHSGGNSIKQFNGSCRIGVGSENAGVISAGVNTVTYNTSGETNGIHLSSTDLESGTFDWTAPSEGTGYVTLYIAGHQGSRSGPNSTLEIVSSEQTTGIQGDDGQNARPGLISLRNYPNPFNAQTVIRYELPSTSLVSVEIYNIVGRQIESLIHEMQPAGVHQVNWDASGRSSGIYFCRIRAGGYSVTARMLLLK